MIWLVILAGFAGALLWLAEVLGAAWYDIQATRAEQLRRRHPYSLRYRKRPLVSALIISNGEPISDCLRSLQASSYRKLEIVVVANNPKTALALRTELGNKGRLIVKRQPTDRTAIISAARRYLRGELVVLLEPSAQIAPEAISHAVLEFGRQPRLAWLLPNVQVMARSVSGTFQSYTRLLAVRNNKLRSLLGWHMPFSGPALFCRLQHLNEQLKTGDLTGFYAADVAVRASSVASFRQWWSLQHHYQLTSWQRLFKAKTRLSVLSDLTALMLRLTLLATTSYALYLALNLQETWLLGLGLLAVALVIIGAVWDDQRLSLKQKLSYVGGLPVVIGFGVVALLTAITSHIGLGLKTIGQHFEPGLIN